LLEFMPSDSLPVPKIGRRNGFAAVHILFLTLTKMDRNRGDAVHVAELARHWARLGSRVTLVASGKTAYPLEGVEVVDAGQVPSGGPARRAWAFFRLVAAMIGHAIRTGRKADVIYTRAAPLGAVLALLAPFHRRPFVLEINGLQADENRMISSSAAGRIQSAILRGVVRFAVRRARALVCVTEELRDVMAREYGAPRERMTVVPNGVNLDLFTPRADPEAVRRAREALGLTPRDGVILYLGALEPWQDLVTLIRAVGLMRTEKRNPVLLVVGDGTCRKALEEEAARLPAGRRAVFTGPVPYREVPAYLALADVCTLPRVSELNTKMGLSPIKLYSYLACGQYVVATRMPGCEFLEENGLGTLLPCGDARAWADALAARIEGDADRRAAVDRARRFAEAHCGWDRTARAALDVCEAVARRT
jgi:glycosyltransferase involved in cell wall biosynthesis